MTQPQLARRRPLALPLLVVVAASALALFWRPAPLAPASAAPAAGVAPRATREPANSASPRPSSPNLLSAPQPAVAVVPAPEPQVAPNLTPAPEPGEHPHPRTPEHEVLQRELQLIGALNDALDLEDAPQLRRLIPLYRQHVPADENKLAQGYERIADCLEHPGPAARSAAARYYDLERASTVRRYVRRICLERE